MIHISSWLTRFPLLAALALTPASLIPAQAQTPIFTPLGDLPGGEFYSSASGVSADGSVVVGTSSSVGATREGFRWTAKTGMVGLGVLPGNSSTSQAMGVSADGSVVVGTSFAIRNDKNYQEAFRWTPATGITGLDALPNGSSGSDAYGVSADGSVVVGARSNEAYRWTASTGMVALGRLREGPLSFTLAYSVSSDGSVVVGTGNTASDDVEGFRWTPATGIERLVSLTGGRIFTTAQGVSGDGATIVGQCVNPGFGFAPFRWTATTGMVSLSDLTAGPQTTYARSVSGDGSVIVGRNAVANSETQESEAFVWTPSMGVVGLKRYLLDNFASALPANFPAWHLDAALSVSTDGTVIVGQGIDPNGETQAWRVKLPVKPSPKWIPLNVTVNRTDNTSRLLWRQNNGRYAVWKLSATGAIQVGKFYGPLADYACDQIAVAPNGQTTLLWKNMATKQVALWTVAADLSSIVKTITYSFPSGWAPQHLAVDQNNALRLSWRKTNNAVALWTIAPATGVVSATAAYGPYPNLQDGPLAVGADGRTRLLWRNTATGGATLWTIPAGYGAPSASYNYNPLAGASPADIAVGADNKTRLLWVYPTGKIALWKIDTTVGGSGAIESGKSYGPITGVSPLGLSVGGDNQTRQLWQYAATGKAALWAVSDPLMTITAAYRYGPLR